MILGVCDSIDLEVLVLARLGGDVTSLRKDFALVMGMKRSQW